MASSAAGSWDRRARLMPPARDLVSVASASISGRFCRHLRSGPQWAPPPNCISAVAPSLAPVRPLLSACRSHSYPISRPRQAPRRPTAAQRLSEPLQGAIPSAPRSRPSSALWVPLRRRNHAVRRRSTRHLRLQLLLCPMPSSRSRLARESRPGAPSPRAARPRAFPTGLPRRGFKEKNGK